MASRGKRILIGIGVGCLAIVLLVVGSCAGFVIWINRPGELIDPDLLVGGDTTGYVAWTLRLEDPGTGEFVQGMLDSLQRMSERNRIEIHPVLDSWLSRMQQRRNEKKIRKMFPLAAVWTLRPGQVPGDDLHLFSLSLEQAGNQMVFMDWVLGFFMARAPDVQVIRHGREKIYRLPVKDGDAIAFFIRGNDLFFTSDIQTATLAVDRLAPTRTTEVSPSEVTELLRYVAGDAPLRGAISNRGGELKRVWKQLGSSASNGQIWGEIRGATFSGGLLDAETFRLELGIPCTNASRAAAHQDELARMVRSILEPAGLPLELQATTDREWVRIEVELHELTSSLSTALDRLDRGR
jgi:hypothetical protein